MKAILAIVTAVFVFSACKKNSGGPEVIGPTNCFDGYIFWGGDPAADGTGWYASTTRDPRNAFYLQTVQAPFNADSTPVHICVAETNKRMLCECAGTPPHYYKIMEIRGR